MDYRNHTLQLRLFHYPTKYFLIEWLGNVDLGGPKWLEIMLTGKSCYLDIGGLHISLGYFYLYISNRDREKLYVRFNPLLDLHTWYVRRNYAHK